jgi:hypothetical protein
MSSKSIPLVIFIIVMIALIAGMLLYKKQTPTTQPTSQVVQNQQPTAVPTVSNPNALPSGTSDTQLNQDSQTINQSMSSIDSDLNSVDQGLNDQQTNLQ